MASDNKDDIFARLDTCITDLQEYRRNHPLSSAATTTTTNSASPDVIERQSKELQEKVTKREKTLTELCKIISERQRREEAALIEHYKAKQAGGIESLDASISAAKIVLRDAELAAANAELAVTSAKENLAQLEKAKMSVLKAGTDGLNYVKGQLLKGWHDDVKRLSDAFFDNGETTAVVASLIQMAKKAAAAQQLKEPALDDDILEFILDLSRPMAKWATPSRSPFYVISSSPASTDTKTLGTCSVSGLSIHSSKAAPPPPPSTVVPTATSSSSFELPLVVDPPPTPPSLSNTNAADLLAIPTDTAMLSPGDHQEAKQPQSPRDLGLSTPSTPIGNKSRPKRIDFDGVLEDTADPHTYVNTTATTTSARPSGLSDGDGSDDDDDYDELRNFSDSAFPRRAKPSGATSKKRKERSSGGKDEKKKKKKKKKHSTKDAMDVDDDDDDDDSLDDSEVKTPPPKRVKTTNSSTPGSAATVNTPRQSVDGDDQWKTDLKRHLEEMVGGDSVDLQSRLATFIKHSDITDEQIEEHLRQQEEFGIKNQVGSPFIAYITQRAKDEQRGGILSAEDIFGMFKVVMGEIKSPSLPRDTSNVALYQTVISRSSAPVKLYQRDIDSLMNKDAFVTNAVVEYYIRISLDETKEDKTQQKKGGDEEEHPTVWIFNTNFYTELASAAAAATAAGKELPALSKRYFPDDILQYKFLIVPINIDNQYSLAVICFPYSIPAHKCGTGKKQHILLFDPLYQDKTALNPDKVAGNLRLWLENEYENEYVIDNSKIAMLSVAYQTKQQSHGRNASGLLVMKYGEQFLRNMNGLHLTTTEKDNRATVTTMTTNGVAFKPDEERQRIAAKIRSQRKVLTR